MKGGVKALAMRALPALLATRVRAGMICDICLSWLHCSLSHRSTIKRWRTRHCESISDASTHARHWTQIELRFVARRILACTSFCHFCTLVLFAFSFFFYFVRFSMIFFRKTLDVLPTGKTTPCEPHAGTQFLSLFFFRCCLITF